MAFLISLTLFCNQLRFRYVRVIQIKESWNDTCKKLALKKPILTNKPSIKHIIALTRKLFALNEHIKVEKESIQQSTQPSSITQFCLHFRMTKQI